MSLRFLTAGESHGQGLLGILEGLPSGLEITTGFLQSEMKRRKLGYGRGARQKIETDEVQIFSGVRFGKTLGSPIGLLLLNRDWKSWTEIMSVEPLPMDADLTKVKRQVSVPRPGHADLVGGIKYDHNDKRNVLERSSARETAMRVALATFARRFLLELGIHVASRVVRIGTVVDDSTHSFKIAELNETIDLSPVRCLDKGREQEMVTLIETCKKSGDTLGGVFEVYAEGVPIGLGSYSQWDRRLESEIGRAFLSLNAIKGVEVGLGFEAGKALGSLAHDEFFTDANEAGKVVSITNRSGGIDGGMSTGQPIVVRAAMKPLATLMKPLRSVDLNTHQETLAHIERSDVCAVPSAAVIGESLLCLSLAEFILEKFGGDSMSELIPRVGAWNETHKSK